MILVRSFHHRQCWLISVEEPVGHTRFRTGLKVHRSLTE
ncbi:hypothetical protein A2U01_0081691, partial [Trifolium medium]|nr:hypothetical protein [Trifolium medium]